MPMLCCNRRASQNSKGVLNEAITPFGSQDKKKNDDQKLPTFDQVITGEVAYEPWMMKNFRDFLKLELNEENLFFYEEVEGYKASKGDLPAKRPEKELLYLPDQVRKDDISYASSLIETFVKENAPKQVNISDPQRIRLLGQFNEAVLVQAAIPSIAFVDAQNEVRHLMQQDSWPRFVRAVMGHNLSTQQRTRRIKVASAFLFLSFLVYALFLAFAVPRWYLFLLLPFLWQGMGNTISVRARFCVDSGFEGKYFKEGSATERVAITCPIVKRENRRRARRLNVLIYVAAIVTNLFMIASTYAIEAGIGYGRY